ncbi:MAG: GNAT family acetyltransferase [Actinomycetota bacterium]
MSWTLRPFERSDADEVVALWQAAELTRPWNDPYLDIERKLSVHPELFLVAVATAAEATGDEGARDSGSRAPILGTVMAGYDGHRGWIYYLATSPQRRGEGIGRALVTEAERLLEERGCPKIQLMIRAENTAVTEFYESLGYESFEVSTLGKRLIPDVPRAL